MLWYKVNVVKCNLAVVLMGLAAHACMGQLGVVSDFRSATWNSNGPRWDVVAELMNSPPNLDVLAVQEAGNIGALSGRLAKPPGNPLPFDLGGFDTDGGEVGVQEFVWNTGPASVYLYYYDRASLPGTDLTNRRTVVMLQKTNIAVVTRQRAQAVILIPPEVRHDSWNISTEGERERNFINRPALGVVVRKSVFFNIHLEPIRNRNEAVEMIEAIQKYMAQYYPQHTWLVMGDFNRTPEELQLPTGVAGMESKKVRSGLVTHSSRNHTPAELDYGVVGGPASYGRSYRMTARLLQMTRTNPSDHKPVSFTKSTQ